MYMYVQDTYIGVMRDETSCSTILTSDYLPIKKTREMAQLMLKREFLFEQLSLTDAQF